MASEAQLNTLQQLYIAYFGRPAEPSGVTYWEGRIDAGTSLDDVANAFTTADEFVAAYGDDTAALVRAAYQNALGREVESDEALNFWVNQLDSGAVTPADLMNSFFGTSDATDLAVLNNRTEVAKAYTAAAGENYDAAASKTLLASVDDTQASVDAALEEIGAEAPTEPSPIEGLDAYQDAIEAQGEAEVAFSDAVVAAKLEADVDNNDDGVADAFDPVANDYVLQAEQAELGARTDLNNARQTATDAKLQQNVTAAQTNVNEDDARYTAEGDQLTAVYTDASGTITTTATGNTFTGYVNLNSATDGTEPTPTGTPTTPLLANDGTVVEVINGTPVLIGTTDEVTTVYGDGSGSLSYTQDATNSSVQGYQNLAVATSGLESSGTYTGQPIVTTPTYTAAQLQSRMNAADASLANNVSANGETTELADELNDAIALYLANNSDVGVNGGAGTALATLQSVLKAYLAEGSNTTEAQVLDAAASAQDVIFSGTKNASVLATGETGDSIESIVTLLDGRNTLSDAADDAEEAFAATENGQALVSAQNAVDAREELIDAVADAQAAVTAVTEAAEAYAAAQADVEAAAEALGYNLQTIDAAAEFGTADADLFTFDAEALQNIGNVVINELSSDDALLLSGYSLGNAESADNNALEVFLTEVNGNAVLQVENSAFGSSDGANGDFTTITLTGVAAADVTVENGVVSFA
ncbi:hypothetical protein DQ403_20260 [Stutzerimonas zhaodongensis]|uniref:DUF4214 domain-containing protein n=1 Tax=Stutzerimonas zhaodongensis TaxID=1176257 RepID=A0A365PPT6_9GAMM|nr:DUF4214 domain-containing protein [Stutzerimonas zhaodongensis]RBA52997.1 hypothetical protein DQ403_20260 [Stutzerimonas zhaodongensis]